VARSRANFTFLTLLSKEAANEETDYWYSAYCTVRDVKFLPCIWWCMWLGFLRISPNINDTEKCFKRNTYCLWQSYKNFPELQQPPRNCRRQNDDKEQVPYRKNLIATAIWSAGCLYSWFLGYSGSHKQPTIFIQYYVSLLLQKCAKRSLLFM
jgi:hypothetical protein